MRALVSLDRTRGAFAPAPIGACRAARLAVLAVCLATGAAAPAAGGGFELPAGLLPGEGSIELRLGGESLDPGLPRDLRLEVGRRHETRPARGIRLTVRRDAAPPAAGGRPGAADSSTLVVSAIVLTPADSPELDVELELSLPGYERARPARFSRRGPEDVTLLSYRGGGLSAARGLWDPDRDRGVDMSGVDPTLSLEASLRGAAGAPDGTPRGDILWIRIAGRVPRGKETVILHLRLVPPIHPPPAVGRRSTVPVRKGAAGLGGWILPGGAGLEDRARELLATGTFPDGAYLEVGDGWQGAPDSKWFQGPARGWLGALRPEAPAAVPIADVLGRLRDLGFATGLWIVPHGAGDEKTFLERPRAFAADRRGAAIPERFLGPYVVDGTAPEGLAWLRDLGRELAATGASALRLGGLSAARDFYARENEYLRDPLRDPLEALRATIAALREGCGDRVILAGDWDTPPEVADLLDAAIPAAPPDSGSAPLWIEGLATARGLWRHLAPSWVECLPVRSWSVGDGSSTVRQARGRIVLAALTGRRLLLDRVGVPEPLRSLFHGAALPEDVHPVDLFPSEAPSKVWDLKVGGARREADLVGLIEWSALESTSVTVAPGDLGPPAAGRRIWLDIERGEVAGISSGPLDFLLLPGDSRLFAVVREADEPCALGVPGDCRATVSLLSSAAWDPASRTLVAKVPVGPGGGPRTVRLAAGSRHRLAGVEASGGTVSIAGDDLLRLEAIAGEVRIAARFEPLEGVPAGPPAAALIPPRDVGVAMEPAERRPVLTWRAGEDTLRWWSRVAGFAVHRDGVEVGRTTDTSFLDRGAPRAAACSYSVAALPADGGPAARPVASEPVRFSVPPARDSFLDAWTVSDARAPSPTPYLRRSASGGPLAIAGARFERGIGMRPPASIEYRLDGEHARFEASIGVDDAARFQGSVVFVVSADGVERFRSETLRGGGDGAVRIRVPIDGAKVLRLSVEDAGDGSEGDLADWGDARVIATAGFRLERAHAHNDYAHPRPLLDALEHGFGSVEADIFLEGGKLLVGHGRGELRPERTLEALYLEPLLRRVRENGGSVYPGGGEVILLIDIKEEPERVWPVLRDLLARHAEMLTVFRKGSIETKAVTVILSGDRPRALLEAEEERLAALDGRPPDLGPEARSTDGAKAPSSPANAPSDAGSGATAAPALAPPSLIPLVSQSWSLLFPWRGSGAMPDAQRRELRRLVETAHAQGRKVRFWGTPDRPEVWRELLAGGVDLLNTDDLAGLERFLRQERHQ